MVQYVYGDSTVPLARMEFTYPFEKLLAIQLSLGPTNLAFLWTEGKGSRWGFLHATSSSKKTLVVRIIS